MAIIAIVPPLTEAAPTPKDKPPVNGAATMDANPVPIAIFLILALCLIFSASSPLIIISYSLASSALFNSLSYTDIGRHIY